MNCLLKQMIDIQLMFKILSRHFFIIIFLVSLVGLTDGYAQYENESDATVPLDKFYIKRHKGKRGILSRINIGLSTGYGSSTLKHKLDGYGIIQNRDSMPVIFKTDSIAATYSNWFNDSQRVTSTPQPDGASYVINSDTSTIGFKAKAFSIPLKATIHYEFNRYRIGGGYSIEYMHIGTFKPLTHADKISGFSSQKSSLWLKHYFGMIGGKVYRYENYVLVADVNIGGYKLGKNFNNGIIKRGIYVNLGVAVERELSEYFRAFVRPSFEIKTFKLNVPDAPVIKHHFNAFYINVGVTYRFPELRKCPLDDCHAQKNHAHGNKEYRSRRHPIYKKQNPHYGENYPVILKYKGNNKKKLNPY